MSKMTIFRKIKLKDVLSWIPNIKRVKPVDLVMYKIESNSKFPFYGQSLTNNGIIDYISIEPKFLNNIENKVYLLVASNNHSINIVTQPFYLKEDHAATSTIGHDKMTLRTALYIKSSIYHVFEKKFDYNAKATQDVLKNTIVSLPFINKSVNELDWDYMEQYVKRIEEQYVNIIEEHLKLLGYSSIEDTILSDDDIDILQKNIYSEKKEFHLADLFDVIKRGKRIKSLDRIDGKLPFITAGVDKMGFSSHIGNTEAEIFPSNSLTIDMFGNTFYRGYKYGADDHVAILYSSSKKYNKRLLQYIQPHIQNAISGKFSYSRNFYASDAPEVIIKLPVNETGDLDTELMEKFIKVIEKKVVHKLRKKMDTELELMNQVILQK